MFAILIKKRYQMNRKLTA